MRYLMLMHPGLEPDAEWMPTAEAVAAMERYNDELRQAGVLLDLAGLHPTSDGALVRFDTGKPVVQDGPFGEAKEVIGGYWLIQAASNGEAVQWASRVPAGGDVFVEVRRLFEPEDFPVDVRAALTEQPGATR
jgi:hypothetical protein